MSISVHVFTLFTTEDDIWRRKVVEDGDEEEGREDAVEVARRERSWMTGGARGGESRGLAGGGGDEPVIDRSGTVLKDQVNTVK